MNDLAIIEKQLQPLAPRFEAVLGKAMPVERLIRTVLISIERLPVLLECTRESILSSAMSAAVLGLEVDGVTGQAYLIPFKGKAQLIIGYKGYNTLAARAGLTITGGVVREGDDFDYELGSAPYVRHRPKLGGEASRKIIAAYASASSRERPVASVVLSIDEVMAVKAKSPGARRNDSPWNDPYVGFPAMAEKTAKRRLARVLPMSAFQVAARMDEAVEEEGKSAHLRPDGAVVIEGQAERAESAEQRPQPSALDLIGSNAGVQAAGTAGATPRASTEPQPPGSTPLPGAAAPPEPPVDIVGGYKRKIDAAKRDGIAAIVEDAKNDPDLFPPDRDAIVEHGRARYRELRA